MNLTNLINIYIEYSNQIYNGILEIFAQFSVLSAVIGLMILLIRYYGEKGELDFFNVDEKYRSDFKRQYNTDFIIHVMLISALVIFLSPLVAYVYDNNNVKYEPIATIMIMLLIYLFIFCSQMTIRRIYANDLKKAGAYNKKSYSIRCTYMATTKTTQTIIIISLVLLFFSLSVYSITMLIVGLILLEVILCMFCYYNHRVFLQFWKVFNITSDGKYVILFNISKMQYCVKCTFKDNDELIIHIDDVCILPIEKIKYRKTIIKKFTVLNNGKEVKKLVFSKEFERYTSENNYSESKKFSTIITKNDIKRQVTNKIQK